MKKRDRPLRKGLSAKVTAVVLPLVVWIGAWWVASRGIGVELLLPSPVSVVRSLWELVGQKETWQTMAVTLGRMLISFVLGSSLGFLIAVLSHRWRGVKWFFDPLMKIIRATPVVSFIVLLWLWFTSGWVPVVIGTLMAMPVVWSATGQALSVVDGKLLELGRAYRFSGWKMVKLIYLPSIREAVTAACRTALGLSWKAGVAAEVLCRPAWAMGTQVYQAKLALESPRLFAWTALVVGCSFLVEGALGYLMGKGGKARRSKQGKGG